MIGWLQPAALWGLLLLAGPLVVHLLRTSRRERIPFPTLRFVRASHAAAVRLRTPSDVGLLALRMALVGLAVCATAQPILLSRERIDTWNARVARAVVVDVSESMSDPGHDPARVTDLAAAEVAGATYAIRVDATSVPDGLRRAAAWLARAPPARAEVVVISDFQIGALTDASLSILPDDTGRRLLRAGAPRTERTVQGPRLMGSDVDDPRSQTIELTPDGTGATFTRVPATQSEGLRILATPEQRDAVSGLLRSVARAGAVAPAASQPIVLRFRNADGEAPPLEAMPTPIGKAWMAWTTHRLHEDASLRHIARRTGAVGGDIAEGWTAVVRDRHGKVLVSAAMMGQELVLDVGAPASSLVAAVTLRGVLGARQGDLAQPEREVATLGDDLLSRWARAPGPVDRADWQRAEHSDARWVWIAVLALLVVEQWVRLRAQVSEDRGIHDAAA